MTGSRLAVDVGTVRIGVAVAAAGSSLAMPLETVAAGADAVPRIAGLVRREDAGIVYIGDPLRLDGTVGPAAEAARAFAREVARALAGDEASGTVEIRMVDERLTSAQSAKGMRAAGRNTRKSRSVLDQAAAVTILQNALDRERATGRPAGTNAEQDD